MEIRIPLNAADPLIQVGKEYVNLEYQRLVDEIENYLREQGGKRTPYDRLYFEKGTTKHLTEIMRLTVAYFEEIITRQGKNYKPTA